MNAHTARMDAIAPQPYRHGWAHDELRRFVRECRDRWQPRDVGLPTRGVRRVPGLRREEVAELAGVSPTWYTCFELGSAVRVSTRFLRAVADALRMTDVERTYLFALADAPRGEPHDRFERRAALQKLAEPNGAAVAVLDGGLRFTSGNAMFRMLFGLHGVVAGDFAARLAQRIFEARRAREFFVDWKTIAAFAAGALRMQLARRDAAAAETVDELRGNAQFEAAWAEARIVDPRRAELEFAVRRAGRADLRLRVHGIGVDDASSILLVVALAGHREGAA